MGAGAPFPSWPLLSPLATLWSDLVAWAGTRDGLWWSNLLILAGIYAVLALALNLINGTSRMFSLGHHGFWALGAYAAAWLTRSALGYPRDESGRFVGEGLAAAVHGWAQQLGPSGPVVFGASALLAMGVAALGGLLIGLPCLRLRGDYLAIVTLGFGEIVRIAVSNSDEAALGGSVGLEVPRVLMEVTRRTKPAFRATWLLILLGAVALVALLLRNLRRSSRGRALEAVAQDEVAAGLLGIDPTRSKVGAFLLGSALAGLAGALYAHYQGTITPLDFSFMEMVKIFLIVVLGGLGSISGCITAALVIVYVENVLLKQGEGWLPAYVPEIPDLPAVSVDLSGLGLGSVALLPRIHWADVWQILFALILILLMIFRPRGLFGRRELPELLGAGLRRLARLLGLGGRAAARGGVR